MLVKYYAEHYYRWNKLIEEKISDGRRLKYYKYKIEDVNINVIKDMLTLIKYDCSDESITKALKTVSKTTNTRGTINWKHNKYINWGSIKANSPYFNNLKTMAIDLGYKVPI